MKLLTPFINNQNISILNREPNNSMGEKQIVVSPNSYDNGVSFVYKCQEEKLPFSTYKAIEYPHKVHNSPISANIYKSKSILEKKKTFKQKIKSYMFFSLLLNEPYFNTIIDPSKIEYKLTKESRKEFRAWRREKRAAKKAFFKTAKFHRKKRVRKLLKRINSQKYSEIKISSKQQNRLNRLVLNKFTYFKLHKHQFEAPIFLTVSKPLEIYDDERSCPKQLLSKSFPTFNPFYYMEGDFSKNKTILCGSTLFSNSTTFQTKKVTIKKFFYIQNFMRNNSIDSKRIFKNIVTLNVNKNV